MDDRQTLNKFQGLTEPGLLIFRVLGLTPPKGGVFHLWNLKISSEFFGYEKFLLFSREYFHIYITSKYLSNSHCVTLIL